MWVLTRGRPNTGTVIPMSVEFQEELFAAQTQDTEAKKDGNEGTTFAADFLAACKVRDKDK